MWGEGKRLRGSDQEVARSTSLRHGGQRLKKTRVRGREVGGTETGTGHSAHRVGDEKVRAEGVEG